MITKQELREEIVQLRFIGTQMSNVCFNLAQHVGKKLDKQDCKLFDQLRRQWDDIKRREQ